MPPSFETLAALVPQDEAFETVAFAKAKATSSG